MEEDDICNASIVYEYFCGFYPDSCVLSCESRISGTCSRNQYVCEYHGDICGSISHYGIYVYTSDLEYYPEPEAHQGVSANAASSGEPGLLFRPGESCGRNRRGCLFGVVFPGSIFRVLSGYLLDV